jgi:large subunit ribosomal protein L25
VPAVIYGGAKEINFHAPAAAFKSMVYTHEFQQAEIKLNGESYRCIMKDLQFDKVTDALIHVDFLELTEGKKVIAEIPLHFTGSAKGVKEGGRLYIKMKTLRVKTLPQYLKEHIEINVEDLELNESIRVEDVKIDNYELLNSPRIPLVSVSLTRQLKEEPVAEAAAPAEGAAAPAETTAAGEKEKEKEKK